MMTTDEILARLAKIHLAGKVIESQEVLGNVWSHAVEIDPPEEPAYLYLIEGGEGEFEFLIFDYHFKEWCPVAELAEYNNRQKTLEIQERWKQANAA